MKLSLEFLGTGTSVGVPVIGCECTVCSSTDPLNKRLRSSALVRGYNPAGELDTTVIIDTSPDFRQQILRARTKVRRLDAVIITHYHADHVVGIDDVRRFNAMQNQAIDCWATPATLSSLKHSFGYVFANEVGLKHGLPCLNPRPITIGEPFEIGCLRFVPLDQDHYVLRTLGFRITCRDSEPLSYCLDVKRIPEQSYEALQGTHTLVLDMLREKPHLTHMNLSEALEAVRRIAPRRTFFAHCAHEVDHRALESNLPPDIRLAYDGLVLEM